MAVVFGAGNLRHQIKFQSRSTTQDPSGQQSQTWSDVMTVKGEILPLAGRELEIAQAINASATHTINVRYKTVFDDLKTVTAMRAIYKGRIFNIGAKMNIDERNRLVQLTASEGLNLG